MAEERVEWTLVKLGEKSKLKNDLNSGVKELFNLDPEFESLRAKRPTNGFEELRVMKRVADFPLDANTEFRVRLRGEELPGGRIIMCAYFLVFYDKVHQSNFYSFKLTVEQTAHIIDNLPKDSRDLVF